MKSKKIVFTAPHKAELLEVDVPELKENEVLSEMEYTVVSGGTERACILGMNNTSQKFPMSLGYCGVGRVVEVGPAVKSVKAGDRVLVYHGCHSKYNIRPEADITKVTNEDVSSLDAAFVIIASMGLGGVRKLEIELGESAMVMGLGILGLLAVQFAHSAGAVPVIAVDPIKERREKALEFGADFAFDPFEEDFVEKVKAVTNGGVNVAIEVTGQGAGLNETLDCMAKFGRVALLGCTRNSDFSVDFYRKVHGPGISLIGAHTLARPESDSSAGYFTTADDMKVILNLCAKKRINLKGMIEETHSPLECREVYDRLVNDKNFPTVVQFDWERL